MRAAGGTDAAIEPDPAQIGTAQADRRHFWQVLKASRVQPPLVDEQQREAARTAFGLVLANNVIAVERVALPISHFSPEIKRPVAVLAGCQFVGEQIGAVRAFRQGKGDLAAPAYQIGRQPFLIVRSGNPDRKRLRGT